MRDMPPTRAALAHLVLIAGLGAGVAPDANAQGVPIFDAAQAMEQARQFAERLTMAEIRELAAYYARMGKN
jgi:hypothetical protein